MKKNKIIKYLSLILTITLITTGCGKEIEIKNGSKVALVAADVPSHTAVQVLATPHVHEDDEYAKKIVSGTDTPNAFVVVLDIDEIFE